MVKLGSVASIPASSWILGSIIKLYVVDDPILDRNVVAKSHFIEDIHAHKSEAFILVRDPFQQAFLINIWMRDDFLYPLVAVSRIN